MSTVSRVTEAAYRLEQMLYHGPGIGLPAPKERNFDADTRRLAYYWATNALIPKHLRGVKAQRQGSTRNPGAVAGRLRLRIEASNLPWPYKQDLLRLTNATEDLLRSEAPSEA